jgi:hypothetical protein
MLNMVDPTRIDAINFIKQYLARSNISSDYSRTERAYLVGKMCWQINRHSNGVAG